MGGYQVMGTREKRYRVETPGDVMAWVDDEIECITAGWLPLASDLEPDGSMRVLYGQLPSELTGAENAGARLAPEDARAPKRVAPTGMRVGWGISILLTLGTFLAPLVVLAKP
jgi:hypothetical protein